MNINECLILKGIAYNKEITIIGGLENGNIKLQVIPEEFEKSFLIRFKMAYDSPEHLNYLHGYCPTGNIHKQPTLECIRHIFCMHMFENNPMTGEEMENTTEKWISLQEPEILKKSDDYDENAVY